MVLKVTGRGGRIFAASATPALAHLAGGAWQLQPGALDRDRAQREFATVALWNAAGCRRSVDPPSQA